jgi:DNA repair protein RadC
MLELLLSYALPGKDLSPIIEESLRRFGSLYGVLRASTVELAEAPGVGLHAAGLVRLAGEIVGRCSEVRSPSGEILKDPQELGRYLLARLGGMREETLLLIFLSSQGLALGEELLGAGTVNQVVTFPRQIMERCLYYNSSALIIVHNHPHGPPLPSVRDREEAERLRDILLPFDIMVKDSIVVGQNRCFSIFKNSPL